MTVLTGGAVHTGDAGRPQAHAVAIRNGEIVALGSDEDVREWVDASARVIELEGRTVVAGFQDAHVHPPHAGMAMLRCDLHDLTGLPAYQAAIAAYARANPDRPWVIGDGWAMPAFPGGTPRREDLDAVVPDRPAFFVNRDGHGAWANSKALDVAGITRDASDPEHGRIERDARGEPFRPGGPEDVRVCASVIANSSAACAAVAKR